MVGSAGATVMDKVDDYCGLIVDNGRLCDYAIRGMDE
jgi:hypothetical protein